MHKTGNTTFFDFFEQKMEMVFDESEGEKGSVIVLFRPMCGPFEGLVDVGVVQIPIPVRRGEAIIEVS